jgi:arylsulfate sulfotransferase
MYVVKTLNSAFLQDPITQKPIIIDKFGKIRGFLDITDVLEMKPLPNGHFLYYKSNNFNEIDLLGNVFHTITPPNPCHHDFEILPNGNIIYTGEDQSINQTMEDKIYEIDYQTGNIVNTINLFNVFDPARQTLPSTVDKDWLHNNSLCYDKTDNSLLLTARNQSLIAKIDMNSKKLFWMISDSSYWNTNLKPFLLKPIGSNFEFAYGEHSVRTSPYDHNKIIVFDNGNARSYTQPLTLAQSYSRLVEYTIDPITQQISQSFDFGKQLGAATYTNATGNVDYLTQDDFLINFGFIIKDVNGNIAPDGATSMRLMEVNRQGNVNMDITIKNTDPSTPLNGFRSYRAHPISFF